MIPLPSHEWVVGRDAERLEIERSLDVLADGPQTMVLYGGMGIGKTTLLAQARESALNRGFRVLTARPVEDEFPLEFSALTDLLDSVPSSAIASLPDPQRRAIDIALRRKEPLAQPSDPRTIATGVTTVLRILADGQPVLLVVDDLPWLDLPSAKVLTYMLRRRGQARIGLLAAVRTDWTAEPAPTAVDGVADITHLVVGPLSLGALRQLVTVRTGKPPGRADLVRLQQLSGGNPLLASELTERGNVEPDVWSSGHSQVASMGRLVQARLKNLPLPARELLLAFALTSAPSALLPCAAVTDPERAGDDLDTLVRAGVLSVSDDRFSFAHPLIRAVVIHDAPPAIRRAAHSRLGGLAAQPEVRARHLALASAGPSEVAATMAEGAAHTAAARAAVDTAAELAELAVWLTPPQDTVSQLRRTALQAEYCCDAVDPDRAASLLEPVIAQLDAGADRAELLRRLARYMIYRGDKVGDWMGTLEQALSEAGTDVSLRIAVLTDLCFAATYAGDIPAAAEYAMSALSLIGHDADPAQVARLCGVLSWAQFLSGQAVRPGVLEQAMAGPDQPVRVPVELRPNVLIGHIRQLTDDLDGARSLYELEKDRVKAEGIETGLPFVLCGLVQNEAYAGNWDAAEQMADEGSDLAEQSGGLPAIALMKGTRALIHVCRGRIALGRSDGEQARAAAKAVRMPLIEYFAAQALALAELSVRDYAAVHRQIGALCRAVCLVDGVAEPSVVRFVTDEIEALIRMDRCDDAAALLDPFQQRSDKLHRRSAQASAYRCRALLMATNGDLAAAGLTITRTLEMHERLPLPFEHARTLLVAAEIGRRNRQKATARSQLTAAASIFERLGSPIWAAHAHAELARQGPQGQSSPHTLTQTETRIADLVAAGMTTHQVAAQLFMGKRTVEAHLTRIYRKLGATTRTEMAGIHLANHHR